MILDTEEVTSIVHLRRLAVWLDGAPGRVGTLVGQTGTGLGIGSAYDQDYLGRPGAVPSSASLPLRSGPYGDAAVRAFFDNLLPEGERRRVDPADVVGLLEALGADCPGAVSVLPEGAAPVKAPGRLGADHEPLDEDRLAALVADVAAGRPVGGRGSAWRACSASWPSRATPPPAGSCCHWAAHRPRIS